MKKVIVKFTLRKSATSKTQEVEVTIYQRSHVLELQKRLIVAFTPPNLPSHVVYKHIISNNHRPLPVFVLCPPRLFRSPVNKMNSLGDNGGSKRLLGGVGWLWWPSSDDTEAAGHGFNGCLVHKNNVDVSWADTCDGYIKLFSCFLCVSFLWCQSL
jgi:hypothetical protein